MEPARVVTLPAVFVLAPNRHVSAPGRPDHGVLRDRALQSGLAAAVLDGDAETARVSVIRVHTVSVLLIYWLTGSSMS